MNINYLVDIVSLTKSKDSVACYTDYLILYEAIQRKQAISLGQQLRSKGFIVETDILTDIKMQIEQAKQRNIRDIIKVENKDIVVISVIQNGIINDIKELLTNG